MGDIHKNIEEYNRNIHKILTVFDYIIADMRNNKKLNPVVTELLIRGKKLNVSLVLLQSYFAVSKNFIINSTNYLMMKIPNKQELQQITFNHSSDIEFKGFINFYKNLRQNHIFLVIDTTLASYNLLPFRKNISIKM